MSERPIEQSARNPSNNSKAKLLIVVTVVVVAIIVFFTIPRGNSGVKKFEFLIDWQAEPTYLGIYYAKHIGEFEKLGLDVTIVQSQGANQAVTAVSTGRYKIATASGGATVLGYNNDADVVSLAVVYPKVPSVVYGLAETGVQKPADLIGKKIGIYPGSITKNEFDAFAKLNGLKQSDLDIVSLTGADIPLLKSKQLDCVLHYAEMSPIVVSIDPTIPPVEGKRIFELSLAEHGVKGYGLNIVTSRETLRKDGDLIKKVALAALNGYREACENPKAAVDAFLEEFPEKDRAYVEKSWARVCEMTGENDGKQSAEGWQDTIDLYQSLGLLTSAVKPEEILP